MSKSYKISYSQLMGYMIDGRGLFAQKLEEKGSELFPIILVFEKCPPFSHMQPAGIAACTICGPR